MDGDISAALVDQVRAASARRSPLRIVGGNSKSFYAPGKVAELTKLNVAGHRGIVAYEPRELVVSVRAGTPLAQLEEALALQGQILPFEPPHFGPQATIGGTIAGNFSGPRRAYAGAARDFVLGVTIINGRGELLRFGGQVMKNVAGYDVSRLMAGALGTLGVIMSVTLKVLPRAQCALTLRQECSATDAIGLMNRWAGQPLPISATAHDGGSIYVRLEGAESAVRAARHKVGGEVIDNDVRFWNSLREHQHGFFSDDRPLWRVSLPSVSGMLAISGKMFMEWGGALRWVYTDMSPESLRDQVRKVGGHATCFRSHDAIENAFTPLSPGLLHLHRRLKAAFDPHGILNPGRLYAEL